MKNKTLIIVGTTLLLLIIILVILSVLLYLFVWAPYQEEIYCKKTFAYIPIYPSAQIIKSETYSSFKSAPHVLAEYQVNPIARGDDIQNFYKTQLEEDWRINGYDANGGISFIRKDGRGMVNINVECFNRDGLIKSLGESCNESIGDYQRLNVQYVDIYKQK